MNEVEVKAHVNNPSQIISALEKLGCTLSEPLKQKDRIFVPNGVTIPVPNGTNVLRVREQNKKYLFTLKQPLTNELDCIEKEVEITSPETYFEIFKLLGFYEVSHVSKTRRTCHYKDYEICLDEVEELGTFIEVEVFADEDGEKIQAELFTFLESLGVSKTDQVFHGYDILMKLQHDGKNN